MARHLLGRAERELSAVSGDEHAAGLLSELRGYVGSSLPQRPTAPVAAADLLLPVYIRKDSFELRLFSTIMTLR